MRPPRRLPGFRAHVVDPSLRRVPRFPHGAPGLEVDDLPLHLPGLARQRPQLGVLLLALPDLVADVRDLAAPFHGADGRAAVLLRLPLAAPVLKRPPVDPRVMAVPLEVPVGQLLPTLPQLFHIRAPVPVALLLLALGARETLRPELPQAHQHVRMNVPVVAVPVGRVNGDVRRVTRPHELLPHEILYQPPVLFERLFVRQGDVEIIASCASPRFSTRSTSLTSRPSSRAQSGASFAA